ncbi:MAG: hypothetical protein DRG69_00755 [Deltaproteobacteria bacterium]|nr:MAG: hypothetical protein DRG69_00755 [Deltaproteobacteria bacterium]
MKVLVAEDDRISRAMLEKAIRREGFEVVGAGDGQEAWELFQEDPANIVVTDWMMPEMDGLELCRRIRSARVPHYVYIIFVSAKGEKDAVVAGLEAGADDYITKPYDPAELRVRLKAGRRIVELERRLKDQNEELRRYLEAAAEVQRSLLPKDLPQLPHVEFAARFIPSAFVSGDIYNVFRLDEEHIGFYQIDVSGHGVEAAFLSVALYQRLSPHLHSQSLLKVSMECSPYYRVSKPSEVVSILDQEFRTLFEEQGRYFTFLYGLLDLRQGELRLSRAGHTLPFLVHRGGEVECLDFGGPPLGFGLPREDGEDYVLRLSEGERLLVMSDGILEAAAPSGGIYGPERVKEVLRRHWDLPLEEVLNRLIDEARAYQGTEEFSDDVSILALQWRSS